MKQVFIEHKPIKPYLTEQGMNYFRLSDNSVVLLPIGWQGNEWSAPDTYYEPIFTE